MRRDHWNTTIWPADHRGPQLPRMIDALRDFHDLLTGADASPELITRMLEQFESFNAELAELQVPEQEQIIGRLDLPGMGQTLTPVFLIDHADRDRLSGTVRFGRYYLGRNGAVHGGAISLLFDALLGRLSASGNRTSSRTAYLKVDYRSITPIDADLRFDARFVKEEGRKRFITAELRHGSTVCVEVDALFIALRPGQP